jgi:hypothetical protein
MLQNKKLHHIKVSMPQPQPHEVFRFVTGYSFHRLHCSTKSISFYYQKPLYKKKEQTLKLKQSQTFFISIFFHYEI